MLQLVWLHPWSFRAKTLSFYFSAFPMHPSVRRVNRRYVLTFQTDRDLIGKQSQGSNLCMHRVWVSKKTQGQSQFNMYIEDIMQNYFIYKTNGTLWLNSKCTCTRETSQGSIRSIKSYMIPVRRRQTTQSKTHNYAYQGSKYCSKVSFKAICMVRMKRPAASHVEPNDVIKT